MYRPASLGMGQAQQVAHCILSQYMISHSSHVWTSNTRYGLSHTSCTACLQPICGFHSDTVLANPIRYGPTLTIHTMHCQPTHRMGLGHVPANGSMWVPTQMQLQQPKKLAASDQLTACVWAEPNTSEQGEVANTWPLICPLYRLIQ